MGDRVENVLWVHAGLSSASKQAKPVLLQGIGSPWSTASSFPGFPALTHPVGFGNDFVLYAEKGCNTDEGGKQRLTDLLNNKMANVPVSHSAAVKIKLEFSTV